MGEYTLDLVGRSPAVNPRSSIVTGVTFRVTPVTELSTTQKQAIGDDTVPTDYPQWEAPIEALSGPLRGQKSADLAQQQIRSEDSARKATPWARCEFMK